MCARAETTVSVFFVARIRFFVKYPDERGSKRMQLNVKVNRVYKDGNATKAICTVTLDEQFAVHGIKVIKTNNGVYTLMPFDARKDADGKDVFKDIFHPVNVDARKALKEALISACEPSFNERAHGSDAIVAEN